jgi:hypothetical protein
MTSEAKVPDTAELDGNAEKPGERVALLTIGMHRSGTSALSGVFVRLGCDAPATLMKALPQNAKGFYESRLVARLNDSILSSAGTSWHELGAVNPSWFDSPRRAAFVNEASELLVSEFSISPLIVLKDPRISLLAPLWFDALRQAGYSIKVAFVYRSAADVAASLTKRNGFDPTFGRLLWLRYLLEAERATRGIPRVFVSYDRLLSNWSDEISRVEDQIDMRFPRKSSLIIDEIERFLTPSMRHFGTGIDNQRGDALSPAWVSDAQAVFERWTQDDKNSSDMPLLDKIRLEFDGALPAFEKMVYSANNRVKSEAALQKDLANANSKIAHANSEIEKILNSNSMKLTAPLRQLMSWINKKL